MPGHNPIVIGVLLISQPSNMETEMYHLLRYEVVDLVIRYCQDLFLSRSALPDERFIR